MDCQSCNEFLKDSRGCNGFEVETEIEGYKIDKCPVKVVTPQGWAFYSICNAMKNMECEYTSGGLAVQSARLVILYNLYLSEVNRHIEGKYKNKKRISK